MHFGCGSYHISTAGPSRGHQKVTMLLTWIEWRYFIWVFNLPYVLAVVGQIKIMANESEDRKISSAFLGVKNSYSPSEWSVLLESCAVCSLTYSGSSCLWMKSLKYQKVVI